MLVYVLVPKRDAWGRVQYQAERHFVRLPLRREDRLAFVERLSAEPGRGASRYLAR